MRRWHNRTQGEKRNAYILFGKHKGKGKLGKPKCMWKGLKLVFDKQGHRVSGCGLGYVPLARYFGHGNESFGSTEVIILPSTPGSSKCSLSFSFPPPKPWMHLSSPRTCHMPRPSRSSQFDRPNSMNHEPAHYTISSNPLSPRPPEGHISSTAPSSPKPKVCIHFNSNSECNVRETIFLNNFNS